MPQFVFDISPESMLSTAFARTIEERDSPISKDNAVRYLAVKMIEWVKQNGLGDDIAFYDVLALLKIGEFVYYGDKTDKLSRSLTTVPRGMEFNPGLKDGLRFVPAATVFLEYLLDKGVKLVEGIKRYDPEHSGVSLMFVGRVPGQLNNDPVHTVIPKRIMTRILNNLIWE